MDRLKDWYHNGWPHNRWPHNDGWFHSGWFHKERSEKALSRSSNKPPVPRAHPLSPEEPWLRHAEESSLDTDGNETLDVSAFVELLQNHRHEIKYLARAKIRMFANESPVNEKKWMDHLRCIESFEQTPELVHSYIQRVFELRSYFSCDLVNAVVLLVGLVPHEWTANAEMVTDQESGLPGILYARATLSSTIWNVLAYYMYVIFNPNLIVDTYYWILGDESKAMSQMRHLADLNHDDPYLVFYVKPFQSFSSSSSIIML